MAGRATRLAAFINRIRTDLKQPAVPSVTGEICATNKEYQGILAAQKQVAASVPAVAFASSVVLTTHDANVHFDCRSQIELGGRLAEGMPKPQSLRTAPPK